MKGTSRLFMGVSIAVVVGLGVVLALLLVLLAELYCSLLLGKRKLEDSADADAGTTVRSQEDVLSPLSSIYAQGVIRAPRSILFPVITREDEEKERMQHQSGLKCRDHEIRIEGLNVDSASSDASPSYAPPQTSQEAMMRTEGRRSSRGDSCGEHFIYISNPIYTNKEACGGATPFETPDTSPSRLGIGGSTSSSSSEEDENNHGFP